MEKSDIKEVLLEYLKENIRFSSSWKHLRDLVADSFNSDEARRSDKKLRRLLFSKKGETICKEFFNTDIRRRAEDALNFLFILFSEDCLSYKDMYKKVSDYLSDHKNYAELAKICKISLKGGNYVKIFTKEIQRAFYIKKSKVIQ